MPPTSQLLGLTRTRLTTSTPRFVKKQQVRFAETMVSTKTSGKQKADWGSQWRKVGHTAMMYGPLVTVLMFWPYGVKPVMDRVKW